MTEKNVKKGMIASFEAVGVVAAQSIGEPGTQMSIAYNERVLIREQNGQIKPMIIGDFIDQLIKKYTSIKIAESDVCELPSSTDFAVPSLKQNGKIVWKRILSCSRHLCGKPLIEIVLRSGRRIRATDNHSFVIRKNNQIVPVRGDILRVGDCLPVIRTLLLNIPINSIQLETYLPKNEFIYGDEVDKIRNSPTFETDLVVPFATPNLSFYSDNSQIQDGLVYPYPLRNTKSGIPEVFELESSFGWVIGAYLSEGNLNRDTPCITNIANRKEFSRIIKESCGIGSFNKHVPEFAFSATEQFICSLLRGYFDEDGSINPEKRIIRSHSRSKELIDGIILLLNRIGIFATKYVENGCFALAISDRYAKLFVQKVGSDIDYKRKALEDLCNLNANSQKKLLHYDAVEMIVGFGALLKEASMKLGLYKKDAFSADIRKFTRKQKIGRETLRKYIEIFHSTADVKKINIDSELSILRSYLEEDIVWDEITKINSFIPDNNFVYDFSVEELETFTTAEGIITHNTMRTFHFAGVAEHVPTGLPRLIEIVDAKKAPKKPIIDIHLKSEYARKSDEAEKIARELSSVFVSDVATVEDDLESLTIDVAYNEKDGKAQGVSFAALRKALEQFSPDLRINDNKITLAPVKEKKKSKKKEGEQKETQEKKVPVKYVRKLAGKIKNTIVKGVQGISKAVVVKGDGEYFIRAGGFNVVGATIHPAVDPKRVYTNNIKEIERIYGIEAARNAIVKEIKDVMDMQKLYVDIRHIMLIADAMTYGGTVKPIGRHGLSGEKVGVLGRAAFEETIKHLINASAFAEEEKLVGVTENIIVGQTVPIGTGKIKLMFKPKKPKN